MAAAPTPSPDRTPAPGVDLAQPGSAASRSPARRPAGATASGTRSGPGRRAKAWRWAARLIVIAAAGVTVMMLALGVGMRVNDAAIEEHLGVSTGTVLSVSPLRTGVEFVGADGVSIRPESVLYPGLLSPGQRFRIEYSTEDPQIARVAGRTADVGNIMIAATLAVTYLIAVPVVWWCRRRSGLPLLGFRRAPGHVAPAGAFADSPTAPR